MHNGALRGFHEIRRDLIMAVDPTLFPDIEGSTDSETLFFLALTFGLVEDPIDAVARAVGFVEDVGRTHQVQDPVQMTVATDDGESLWALRYSSERQSRSLFYSIEVAKLRALHPEVEVMHSLGGETRFVVSEPPGVVAVSVALSQGPGTRRMNTRRRRNAADRTGRRPPDQAIPRDPTRGHRHTMCGLFTSVSCAG